MTKAKNPILSNLCLLTWNDAGEEKFATVTVKAHKNSYSGVTYMEKSFSALRARVDDEYPNKLTDGDWDRLIDDLMGENEELQEKIDTLGLEICRLETTIDRTIDEY